MDFLRVIIGALILAILVYIAVYALFALFAAIGFWWSFLILFIIFAIILAAVPNPWDRGLSVARTTAAY